MQYVFFEKGTHSVQRVYNVVWGKAPEGGEFSRIFVLNTFNCK